MTGRIGIMGGMFDPVHLGHVRAAIAVTDTLALDRVLMVPCSRPNHREGASASARDRQTMLELACAGTPLQVDDRELRRPGVSYMADTLRDIAGQFPEALRVFIQGWDSFLTLPEWERWEELFRFCHLCAVSRPGSHLPTADSEDRSERIMAGVLSERQVSSPGALAARQAGRILVLDGVNFDVSSTRLRSLLYRARQGDSDAEQAAAAYLPAPVAAYINAHQLY